MNDTAELPARQNVDVFARKTRKLFALPVIVALFFVGFTWALRFERADVSVNFDNATATVSYSGWIDVVMVLFAICTGVVFVLYARTLTSMNMRFAGLDGDETKARTRAWVTVALVTVFVLPPAAFFALSSLPVALAAGSVARSIADGLSTAGWEPVGDSSGQAGALRMVPPESSEVCVVGYNHPTATGVTFELDFTDCDV